MNQLAEAAKAFYNMSLAHEITVDSEFRLEKYEPQEKRYVSVMIDYGELFDFKDDIKSW